MAAEHAVSGIGKENILAIQPQNDPKRIKRMLNELDEATQFLAGIGRNPVEYFTDIKGYLEKVNIGGVLMPDALLDIKDVCTAAVNAKNIIIESTIIETLPFLKDLAVNIYNCKPIINEINNAISPEGDVLDGASSQLRQIRRSLRMENDKVRGTLERLIRSQNVQKYLQEAVITERNGRLDRKSVV